MITDQIYNHLMLKLVIKTFNDIDKQINIKIELTHLKGQLCYAHIPYKLELTVIEFRSDLPAE